MTTQTTSHNPQALAEVQTHFRELFMVMAGRVYRKSKSGRRAGKPLHEAEILSALGKHTPALAHMPLQEQGNMLTELIAQDTPDDMGGDAVLDQVDNWFVPLLMAFRWRSDGTTVIGYYWKKYAEVLSKGMDPEDDSVVRELFLCSDIEGKGLATALAKDTRVWDAYEATYRQACNDPDTYVTPKAVRDGVRFYHTFRNYLAQQAQAWASDTRFAIQAEPKTITNRPGDWAFWHFDPDMIPEDPSPTPNWDGWLAKLVGKNSAKIFRAWVFSVFIAKNRGRQLLWIEDNGAGGKGTIAAVLQKFMGDIGCGALSASMLDSEFGAASAYGKRLLVHPDNKNARLISSALIHQITGGDMILVRRLYETAFTARMNAKVMVMANCPPDSDVYNFHERSRLIYMRLDPNAKGADRSHLANAGGEIQLKGDIGFEGRLLAEMPSFLSQAAEDYIEMCPTNSNIVLPKDALEQLDIRCASMEQEKFEEFFHETFELAPGKFLASKLVREVFDAGFPGTKGNIGFASFRKYMQTLGVQTGRGSGLVKMRIFMGVKARNTVGDDLTGGEI